MKKHLKIVVAALLVMACVGALLGFAACNDKKESAKITAELEQNFVYDGQVHNVVATLSHDEAELSYDPQQGFKDIGTYTVTISAPATENYNAPAPVTVTVNILDPSSIAKEELAGKLASGVTDFNISKSRILTYRTTRRSAFPLRTPYLPRRNLPSHILAKKTLYTYK